MTDTKTATREAVTLDLEPQAVKPLATIEPPTPAPPATADDAAAVRAPLPPGASPLDKITELLNRGISLETLDQFLEMQAKWEAREAEKAYLRAMAAFKAEGVGTIAKAVHVHYTTRENKVVDYWHEELADVVAAVLPVMARYGLSHSWKPRQEGRGEAQIITVRTVVTHTGGHADGVELYAVPDSSGGKNSIQAVKSTVSYLERIGLLAILGLAAKGQDNDGRGAPPLDDRGGGGGAGSGSRDGDWTNDAPPPARGKPETRAPQATADAEGSRPLGVVTEKQVGLLVVRLREKSIEQTAFCNLYGIPALEDLPRARMDEALKWIGAQR